MIKQEDVLKIGQLGKPHGVRGEISFTFTTDVWDRAEAEYLILMIDGILVPFFLETYRFRGEHSALLKFVDVDSMDDLQDMVGAEVYFPKELVVEDDETEYTWGYFEGFRIIDLHSGDLGQIVHADESTVNVLFELENGTLIPAVEDFIRDIDHEQRIMYMQLPEGLLEI